MATRYRQISRTWDESFADWLNTEVAKDETLVTVLPANLGLPMATAIISYLCPHVHVDAGRCVDCQDVVGILSWPN